MPKRKMKEGSPLPDTREMQAWRKQYLQMSFEEHKAKLRELGLCDEEIEGFKQVLKEEKQSCKSKA